MKIRSYKLSQQARDNPLPPSFAALDGRDAREADGTRDYPNGRCWPQTEIKPVANQRWLRMDTNSFLGYSAEHVSCE